MEKSKNKKIVDIQQITILVLIVILIIATSTTVTFAIFTRFDQRNVGILFGNPVIVNITGTTFGGSGVDYIDTIVVPGDLVPIRAGFTLGTAQQASTSAFVRTRLSVTSNIPTDNNLVLIHTPVVSNIANNWTWVLVNFGTVSSPDLWYVLVYNDTTQARVVTNGQTFNFIDGDIRINENATSNDFGNERIELVFTISAIQSMNLPSQPIPDPNNYYMGFNPFTGLVERIIMGTWPV